MRKLLGLLVVLAMAGPAVAQTAQPTPAKAEAPATATASAKPVTITVTYTEQEAAVLLRMLDMAVRQGGLDVAGNVAYLATKIKDAAKTAGVAQAPPPKGANP